MPDILDVLHQLLLNQDFHSWPWLLNAMWWIHNFYIHPFTTAVFAVSLWAAIAACGSLLNMITEALVDIGHNKENQK